MTGHWWPAVEALVGPHGLSASDLFGLFLHFAVLSLLAIGGAITTAPGMHGYLVKEHGWLDDAQFTSSIALAQAAPGPNVLFVAVLGWSTAGALGVLATLAGILAPSSVLALGVSRFGAARRDSLGMQIFTHGLTPLTLGLLAATSWLLTEPVRDRPAAYGLVALSVAVMLRTRWSPMWLIALGGVVGAAGWV